MDYAALHVKSNFSFLEGASHPDELVGRAAALGYAALALTDRASLAGVVRAHGAAKEAGLKLVIGAEIEPDDALPVVLWATDRASYGRLCRLITDGRRRAAKGQCQLSLDDVDCYREGLLAGVVPTGALNAGQTPAELLPRVRAYRDRFGDRCYLLGALCYGSDDRRRWAELESLARRAKAPLVADGDVRYHVPERQALGDVLTAIRHGCTVREAGQLLWPNAQRYLKSDEELAQQFGANSAALRRTVEVAARCQFSLDELRYEYPEELAPPGQTPMEHLRRLTWIGAEKRYPQGVPDKIRGLIEHELRLIAELRYEAYFLTVWDLVRFARQNRILCQGRGSAANSVVCYCLGVTSVDPARLDLLFERFISRERNEAPDIDVDFEHERREEVLQYIYEKYGRDRAGMTAEVITYRPRSAVRDVGKALGFAPEAIDRLAKGLEHFRGEPHLAERCREAGIDPASGAVGQLVELAGTLIGFPRHLSQHTGGMVITHGPLCEMTPIENAAMPGRTVIEWNKDDLDELGILKVDCLALGMLTAIRKCFHLIGQHTGRKLSLAGVPPDDRTVYRMISRADTMGVFQIESRAQMSMLPRLRPRSFYDLVIEVAIVRPGPIQGNMVHPYLRRRNGDEAISYPNEAIRQVLEKTLGVPLFQEQAMRLAVVAAGFTPGEADQLRRAMGAWRRPGVIDHFHRRLIEGMAAHGLSAEYAQAVFQQIRGFGDYGFPESHAASFALLVYVSAWLKCHYQAAFTAALLNSQPMGFYAPAQLVRNARDHGVEVRAVDVNHSQWDCTLEDTTAPRRRPADAWQPALRLGFRMLDGWGRAQAEQVLAARGDRPFQSMDDFSRRTRMSRAAALRLARAGVFESVAQNRRGAMWQALASDARTLPLFADLEEPDRPAALPVMTEAEEVLADYRTTGLSLRAHPVSFLRDELQKRYGALPAAQLAITPDGKPVRVAGIVLVRQRPGTAKGITFVTLEDETGQANLIIRPDVWNRFRGDALRATLLLVHGRLQRHGSVIHVLVSRLANLSELLRGLDAPSRNFC